MAPIVVFKTCVGGEAPRASVPTVFWTLGLQGRRRPLRRQTQLPSRHRTLQSCAAQMIRDTQRHEVDMSKRERFVSTCAAFANVFPKRRGVLITAIVGIGTDKSTYTPIGYGHGRTDFAGRVVPLIHSANCVSMHGPFLFVNNARTCAY